MPTPSDRVLRALVVENDATNRELLARVLRLHDCQADTAVGAQQALALLGQPGGGYDLLITDLKMEPLDGTAFLGEVARLPADQLPRAIVVLSGFLPDYYQKLAALHLELELFQKPIHLPSLVNILDRLRSATAGAK